MLKWCVVSLDMMHKVNLGVELPAIGNAHSNMFVYTPNYTYAQVLMEVMESTSLPALLQHSSAL